MIISPVSVLCMLFEHRMNTKFRGSPHHQLVTICLVLVSQPCSLHTGSKSQCTPFRGKNTRLAKTFQQFQINAIYPELNLVIFNSSYTVSLTSILTVQQLSSLVEGLDSLIANADPVGYQYGSFAKNHSDGRAQHCRFKVGVFQLGPNSGGVASIIDELPYIEPFLSSYCNFKAAGNEFTRAGWGFAFPRDSPLAVDLSTAVLTLSENGDLQRIHDKLLSRKGCSLQDTNIDANRLTLGSFWGLFLICGLACFIAVLVFFMRIFCQCYRYNSTKEADQSSIHSRTSEKRPSRLSSFKDLMSFVDKKEEDFKIAIKNTKRKASDKQVQDSRQHSLGSDESLP